MEPKVFMIFFATFLLQVICIKASVTFRSKKLDDCIPDVMEIQNMTKVLLEPLLSVQPYFTSNNKKVSACFETENQSYKDLTNNLAGKLRREMIKIQGQSQGKQVYDSLQNLITALSQVGPYLEKMVSSSEGRLTAVGQYIDITKEKIKKLCDELLLTFYKLKLSGSNIAKQIEGGIVDAYYETERKSNQIVSVLIKCIKEKGNSSANA